MSGMNCADNWYGKLQLFSRQKFQVPFFLFVKRGIPLIPREKGCSTRVRLIFFSSSWLKKKSSPVCFSNKNTVMSEYSYHCNFIILLNGLGLVNEQRLVPTLLDGCTKRNQAS